ncbi:TetR family transcriptional regulator [Chitinophaga sp. SYP-B3965]|jgi:AcrR family transcriptional regulator|uniref:TetR/AcrR family transcriptional regulator n=1 Tax=Chitinophaga sp. SYP-B3965 TaxID=2663120 RepID=UPI0012998C57|nr:TetR/AcrR family transcriptional regulator [Chitinophaga sp. SYP-B3965]MRG46587.1 TetR family transcriptional regulator [Chitinophaga sp. SYP-B3965]
MRERILDTALRLFRTFGIKSITMQDIARDCGISKKTVYEYFADKQELVDEVTTFMISAHGHNLEVCSANGKDAIDELVSSLRFTETFAKSINPVLLFELEKYHPSAWKTIADFRNEQVTKIISDNLDRGIREGLYRSNINIHIMSHMRLMQLNAAFNPVDYPATEFDLHEVMYQVTEHYIRGIATPEGNRRLDQYLTIKELSPQ